jgi:hypothetical protein
LCFAFLSFIQLDIFSLFTRTLSTSDDVEDRENEKGRLEEAYEKCDRDLDELIVQHYTELTTAIRTYQSITERITNSRNKIKQVSFFFFWLVIVTSSINIGVVAWRGAMVVINE